MRKKAYRAETEGAVFDRRRTAPPTAAELEELLARDPLRDRVTECQELALSVLSDHYGHTVELIKNDAHVDAKPLAWPIAGSVPEIVLDAFEILDLSRSIRSLEHCAGSDAFDSHRANIVRNLANCMLSLGKLFMMVSLRLEGIESDVFARVSQKQNLLPREKIVIEETTLREEWDRIKRIKPHANKQVWRECVAERLRTSERTIKRRLTEFKIV